jgi:hypothetical protein
MPPSEGDLVVIESGCDFLALEGWKREGGGRIVDHSAEAKLKGWRRQPNFIPISTLRSPVAKSARHE